jgi:hypothetical protein
MKTDLKRQKQKSLRKNVLKMIREKQQEEYKKLFGNKSSGIGESSVREQATGSDSGTGGFHKDFDESLEFFSSLAKKPENQDTPDYTLKKYPNLQPQSVLMQPNMSIPISSPSSGGLTGNLVCAPAVQAMPSHPVMSPVITHTEPPLDMFSGTPYVVKPYIPPPPPTYGCLKNGTLPTYRTLKQRLPLGVQPMQSSVVSMGGSGLPSMQRPISSGISQLAASPTPSASAPAPSYTPPSFMMGGGGGAGAGAATGSGSGSGSGVATGHLATASEIAQKYALKQAATAATSSNKNKLKYLKQKKIFKRTYRVGRSKVAPRVGVLVSNRTIRNRISTQSQLLKQTPIQEVRKFLIKKGFIKIGSNAPNNVLRKMYESVSLVCGEIENHNPDTLLFNFLNDTHP